jgi:hypothetical protein
MTYEYKGQTPVHVGDTIELFDEGDEAHEGSVLITLASQFVAEIKGQGHFYRFYVDRGVTWQLVKETS